MVILYEPFGGLSNRMFQHIHLHAFCKANNIEFVNPFLNYNVKYFYKGRTRNMILFRKLLAAFGMVKVIDFNENCDVALAEQEMKTEKTVFVKGWYYRNKPLTMQYREYYRNLFFGKYAAPDPKIIVPGKINVGIHIRRGDYALWENGKFFYDDSVYINAMKRMNELLDNNCHFLIFTNDKMLNKAVYKENSSSVYFSWGPETIDHYRMSCCNYLLGPPSSFTCWASYLGSTPLCMLHETHCNFTLENFDVIDG